MAVVWVFSKIYRIRLWFECIGSRIFSSLFTHLFLVATRFKHCVTVISCLYHSFLCEQYLLVIYLSWWLKINNLSICGIYIIICRNVHRICCTVQLLITSDKTERGKKKSKKFFTSGLSSNVLIRSAGDTLLYLMNNSIYNWWLYILQHLAEEFTN